MNNTAQVININQGKSMPSKNGYVMAWRDIKKQPWYSNPDALALFTHILLSATSKPLRFNFKGVECTLNAGQYATTYIDLGKVFKFDKSKVRRLLGLFESNKQITKELLSKGHVNKGFVINLTGWNKWQNNTEFSDTPPDTPSDTPKATNIKGYNGYSDTPPDTPPNTVLNNNILNNNNICQNSIEFEPVAKAVDKTPHLEIIKLFGEILPSLPQPKKITSARKSILRARHINDLESDLNNWRTYFEYIRDNCKWMLTGNYNITFDYLTKEANLVNIWEGAKDDRK